jgi:nicotinamide phosphoribosyltransferase
LNRDTLKFAFKCSHAVVDGEDVDVFKTPVTDPGKNSKKGKLDLHIERYSNQVATTEGPAGVSMMETVYENGKILKRYTLDEIRKNAEIVYGQYTGWMDKYFPHHHNGIVTHYTK